MPTISIISSFCLQGFTKKILVSSLMFLKERIKQKQRINKKKIFAIHVYKIKIKTSYTMLFPPATIFIYSIKPDKRRQIHEKRFFSISTT